jgi:hypothetical protein
MKKADIEITIIIKHIKYNIILISGATKIILFLVFVS